MLTSAAEYYRRQQSVTAAAVRAARRAQRRELAAHVAVYQTASVMLAESSATTMLDEQGIDPEPVGSLIPAGFVTDAAAVTSMVEATASAQALDVLVATLVSDAGRSGMGTTVAARPAVTGHVRHLQPPSCGRCAVLAGRFYRWSTGFQRHPQCDCQMVPSNETAAPDLIRDPQEAFRRGEIRGLSAADAEAIEAGADISQVVNVRRKAAGLVDGSSVVTRAGRLTPQGVFRVASDRDEAVALLRRYGYLR